MVKKVNLRNISLKRRARVAKQLIRFSAAKKYAEQRSFAGSLSYKPLKNIP